MYFFTGIFKIKIQTLSAEIKEASEAVIVKSNVDLLDSTCKGNAVNIVLRSMAQSEGFSGFNKVIDAEQNVIDLDQMDDLSDELYGVGNQHNSDINGYFSFRQKISENEAKILMLVDPHVIEINL